MAAILGGQGRDRDAEVRDVRATFVAMNRCEGLAFSCASALCILPWSDGVIEPKVYKLPESSLGGIAATPDLVFVPTADSAIHCIEPNKDSGVSEVIRVGASASSATRISALLFRSSDGTLVFARGSKVYRQHIDSNQLKSTFKVLFSITT